MPPNPATPDFSGALPDRPIAVRPPQTIAPLSAISLVSMLFALLAGALWWLGPDLARLAVALEHAAAFNGESCERTAR